MVGGVIPVRGVSPQRKMGWEEKRERSLAVASGRIDVRFRESAGILCSKPMEVITFCLNFDKSRNVKECNEVTLVLKGRLNTNRYE